MKSLKGKMVLAFTTLVLILCIILTLTSIFLSRQALISNVSKTVPKMAEEGADIVNSHLQGTLDILTSIASENIITSDTFSLEAKALYLDEKAQTTGFNSLYVASLTGESITSNNEVINVADREYFKDAVSGKLSISDPIISKADSSLIIVYAVPIMSNDKIIGVICGAKDGNVLSTITNSITFGETGKAFMLSKNGNTIAHSNDKLVLAMDNDFENVKNDSSLQPLVDVETKMVTGEVGVGEYEYDGVTKYVGYAPVAITGWSFAVNIEEKELLSELDSLKITTIIVSSIFLLIFACIIFLISTSISKSIKHLSGYLKLLANGELNHSIDVKILKQFDEIGDMARASKSLNNNFKEMIQSIKETSNIVDINVSNLSAVSEEMTSSSMEVASSIQEMANGVSLQSESLIDISNSLTQFGEQLEIIVISIKEIDGKSTNIDEMANESNSKMQKLIESVNNISASFKEFSDMISNLGQDITKINSITNVINGIAEQTNLLSLNASIEAARAGDSGRGFAVVADEIRKLADQSKTSAQDINKLINGISNDSNKIIDNSEIINEEIKAQKDIINVAMTSFNKIIEEIALIAPGIEEITQSATSINNEKDHILEKVSAVSSVSAQASASTEEITASMQEMSASSEEVASSSNELSTKTQTMINQVNKFIL